MPAATPASPWRPIPSAPCCGAVAEQHQALGKQLFGDDGKLRSFVNVYIGDEDIRYLQGEATP
jgi:molybdopterin synthase subunit MoaD